MFMKMGFVTPSAAGILAASMGFWLVAVKEKYG